MKSKNIRIKLKFIEASNLNINTCYIKIYNSKQELVSTGTTNKKGNFYFDALYNHVYKIIAIENGISKIICTSFISNQKTKELTIIFPNQTINKLHPITIEVTDENYQGLPITKGEIKLWKNI